MRRSFTAGRIGAGWLLAALLALIAGHQLAIALGRRAPHPYAHVQRAAAERMLAAEARLKEVVLRERIEILADDLNKTGLIGPEWTFLTTTPGAIEAKRSALNPNFAALMVHYYEQAGLKAGDRVALGLSGSFPGLSIAALCAAGEMGLDVRVIASFGASMYGATRPELTVPRMFGILRDEGLVDYTLLATSPGGSGDRMPESFLFGDVRPLVARLAAEAGVEFIDRPSLEESIARRLALYGEDIRCFVNVGGASANSGESAYTLAFPNGLVLDPPPVPTSPNRGLAYEYAARGVPVINLLNVRGLCAQNGLPYDPAPLPPPGEGAVYFRATYPQWALLTALALAAALLAAGRWRGHRRNV